MFVKIITTLTFVQDLEVPDGTSQETLLKMQELAMRFAYRDVNFASEDRVVIREDGASAPLYDSTN